MMVGYLQILEGHVELSFHLQQQQLIELIRENKIEEALDFAEAFLAPIGEENPDLLKELGKPSITEAFENRCLLTVHGRLMYCMTN